MGRRTAISLAALAIVGVAVSGGMRFVAEGAYGFSCFYMQPIGPKVCDVVTRDAVGRGAFWSTLGFLNVFWILLIVIVLLPKRWQKN